MMATAAAAWDDEHGAMSMATLLHPVREFFRVRWE